MDPVAMALAAALLLVIRTFAAAAEVALSVASPSMLKDAQVEPDAMQRFAKLKARPEPAFASLRGAQVVSLALAAALLAVAGGIWFQPLFDVHVAPGTGLGWPLGAMVGGLIGAVFATVLEVGVRALAAADPARWAVRTSGLALGLARVLLPLLRAVGFVVNVAVKPFGATARFGPLRPSLEEIHRLLEEEAGKKNIDPQSPRLIRNIFELSQKTAREVMVPRTEVVAIDVSTPPADILRVLAEEGHSRMPVFKDSIDNIVGTLHARDLVPLMQHPELIVLHDLLRPAAFIPWNKSVGELIRELQKKKLHMGLVVDEYGGFLGVVTLEDALEVIVGDIRDEFDEDIPDIEPVADGSFLVRGTAAIAAVEKFFAVEIPDGPYETIGGFLSALAGAIPENGDRFFVSGLQLTVHDRALRSVRRVRVQRVKKDDKKESGRVELRGRN